MPACATVGAVDDLAGTTQAELEDAFAKAGLKRFHAGQVLGWVHKKGAFSFAEMSNLPAALRKELSASWSLKPLEVRRRLDDPDGTTKFLFAMADGQAVESVLIPAPGRWTLCISTQVGCAVGCVFCASGLNGLSRNLTTGEIVNQVLTARKLGGRRIDNLVFMGMGEPFQNFSNVMKAVEILIAPWGSGIGQRHVTVSTSGLPEGIRRFAKEGGQVRLAISLHAPNDPLRDRLVPLNKRFPLPVLLDAVRDYQRESGRQVTWEYVLLGGVNDGNRNAEDLAHLVKPFRGTVNLIPFNPVVSTGYGAPSPKRVNDFAQIVRGAGIVVTVRREKGRSIAAACGQLALQSLPAAASPEATQSGIPAPRR